jgi:hypothetical protein
MRSLAKVSLSPALCLAVLLVSSACASAARRVASRDLTFCGISRATVYVQNDNWLDVVLYAVIGGSKYRIGQVSSIQTASFSLPQSVMAASTGLYILADPIGAVNPTPGRTRSGPVQTFTTGNIMLAPGHTIIEIRLDNSIDLSSYKVALEAPEAP